MQKKQRSGLAHRTTGHEHQSPDYTRHAKQRAAQRSVSRNAVAVALAHGRKAYGKQCIHYILGRRHIERMLRRLQAEGAVLTGAERARFYDLEGTVVRCSLHDDRVITVFNNPEYRHKEHYVRPRQSRTRPHVPK